MSRILRQADQWLLGADEDQDGQEDDDNTASKTNPPAGTEQFMKGPAIMPGLNKVLNSPGPGPTDGTPERWPSELPGDEVLHDFDKLKNKALKVLPGGE